MPRKALCLLAFAVSSGAVRVDEEVQAEGTQDLAAAASELLASGSTEFELRARAARTHDHRASVLELSVARKDNAAQKAADRKVERAQRSEAHAASSASTLRNKAAHSLELAKKAGGDAKYAEAQKDKAVDNAEQHGSKEEEAAKSGDAAMTAAEASARKNAEEEVAAASEVQARQETIMNKQADEAKAAAEEAKRRAAQSAAFKEAQDAAVSARKAEDVAAHKKTVEREAVEKAEEEAAEEEAAQADHKRKQAEAAELRHKQAEEAVEVAKKDTEEAKKEAAKLEQARASSEDTAIKAGAAHLKAEKESMQKASEASQTAMQTSGVVCAAEGGTCHCVGVAVFAEKADSLEHTLASPVKIKNADGNIGCNSEAFHDVGDQIAHGAPKQCWCVSILAIANIEQKAYSAKLRAKDALKKADELDDMMTKHQALVEEEIEREERDGQAVIEKVQHQIKKVERKVDIAGRRAVDVAKQVDNN